MAILAFGASLVVFYAMSVFYNGASAARFPFMSSGFMVWLDECGLLGVLGDSDWTSGLCPLKLS